MTTLTYRPNKTGTLHAAYLGECRVGYVEHRKFDRWLWQLSLIRPDGGCYVGIEDDETQAHYALETALEHWLASARLQHKTMKRAT